MLASRLSTGAGPEEDVATWLPNDPFVGGVGYAGYCGHPPIQQTTVPAPLNDEEKAVLNGTELVGLQVVFRHGSRVPATPTKLCFNLPHFTSVNYTCGIRETFAWTKNTPNNTNLRLETIYPPDTGRCGTGRLQDEAALQFKAVAKALKTAYDFDQIGIHAGSTFLRADEVPRTQASAFLLASELFPNIATMDLHLMPEALDPWGGKAANCPLMLAAEAEFAATVDQPSFASGPHGNKFAQRYADVTGTLFLPISGKDCLTEAVCTPGKLPPGFTKEMFLWAMNKSIHAQRVKYAAKPSIATVLSAPALWDLQDRLREQIHNRRNVHRLALYSTHDNVMVRLLSGVGLWDGEWPAYAETLILESWRTKSSRKGNTGGFFRIVRRGKPLIVPGCNNKTVCSEDVFHQLGWPWLRDKAQMSLHCTGAIPTKTLFALPIQVMVEDKMRLVRELPSLFCLVLSAAFGGLLVYCSARIEPKMHHASTSVPASGEGYIRMVA